MDKFFDCLKQQFPKTKNVNEILCYACETGNSKFVENIISDQSLDINSQVILSNLFITFKTYYSWNKKLYISKNSIVNCN